MESNLNPEQCILSARGRKMEVPTSIVSKPFPTTKNLRIQHVKISEKPRKGIMNLIIFFIRGKGGEEKFL